MPFFVQFPHPGREHTPSPPVVGTVMPWNVGDHKRKFPRAQGCWSMDGSVRAGELAFWGEWEPQSKVVEVWPNQGALPRFLHQPQYDVLPSIVEHQNTDPLVFGERFLYTNCKQLRISKLQHQEPGSLILFGTGRGEGFILDTVFVVGEGEHPDYAIGEISVIPEHATADAVVLRPLASLEKHRGKRCRAYQSVSHEEPFRDLFSYVPCRPLGADVRFARPLLAPVGALKGLKTRS